MSARGYVVRGIGRLSGRTLYCAPNDEGGEFTGNRARAEHATLAAAIGAERTAHASCRDVVILAVAEDGTETPLPSYEEALAEIGRLTALLGTAFDPVDGLEAKLAERTAEREEARDWVRRLTREQRVLTCAFCGAEYPPGTPESNDAALTAHVRVCLKHPMREVEKEIERLRTIEAHARHLMQSADLNTTSGERAGITCDEEPFTALREIFEAEREAARTIPGLVCAECDRLIYRGEQYAGKGGHAAHKPCRNWPAGTTFKVAGDDEQKVRTT